MKLDSLYLDRDRTGQGASLYSTAVKGQQGRILCTIYTAGGKGMHPVLIFTHGYPGHEKNLDLAQSLRRMGFHSVVFFYRGSWGSEGEFSFNGSIKDTQAVLDFVLTDTQHGFDKKNIFFIGHSLGCITAARMIALYPEVRGGVFLAPCDFGKMYLLGKGGKSYSQSIASTIEEGIPYVNGTDSETLIREIKENLDTFSIEPYIEELAKKPILWISSPEDEVVSEQAGTLSFMQKLKKYPDNRIQWHRVASDHYFSNIRVQISMKIANFLLENIEHSRSRFNYTSFEEELIYLIRQNLSTVSLGHVAEYFQVSVPYVSELIRQITGHSFTDLVLKIRMEEAGRLLAGSALPIADITKLSGYQEASYFMKVFKKYYGCTPTQYRVGAQGTVRQAAPEETPSHIPSPSAGNRKKSDP
ncbi:MAG: alpha/beta fold hydrolase [Enterocloster asparagiformis]|nr:alpha/beta fold hydrolase [Enterocloster asparagiformis]